MHLAWRDVEPYPGGQPIMTSVLDEEIALLCELGAGRQVLEIGSAYGYSAVRMAMAGAEHVTAVDNHSGGTWLGDTRTRMQANLEAAGVAGKVTIVQSDSKAALAALAAQGRTFGLIFIDGDHSYAGAVADIDAALPLLEPGGSLAVHDYGETCCCPDVAAAVWDTVHGRGDPAAGTLYVREF